MWPIEEIHERCFDYLLKYHYDKLGEGSSCHFRTRVKFEHPKEKYWFWGGKDYVAISFWTGYDKDNITPNIYLDINTNGRVSLFLSAKADLRKKDYLAQLSGKIEGIENSEPAQWIKNYTLNFEQDYISCLKHFLKSDKDIIDRFLSSTSPFSYKESTHLNEGLGFIADYDFYRMVSEVVRERNETSNTFFVESDDPYNTMPLCIKSLEVINFKGIEHLKIKEIPVDAKWIVLTGENGFGKSSVLQSIAVGLIGQYDGSNVLMSDKSLVILEALGNKEEFINASFNFETRDRGRYFNSKRGEVAAYGASRLSLIGENDKSNGVAANLFNKGGGLINIETELIQSSTYNVDRYNLIKNAILKLIPDLVDIKIEVKEGRPIVQYAEKDAEGRAYKYVEFEDLASGFRSIIAIVGDIISRLTRENKEYKTLADVRGVVIIDELELHLHPKYQRMLPSILTEIFPRVLFIASTHSPIPLLGMPKETVLLRVDRNNEEGVTVRRLKQLEKQIKNLLPNTILTSDFFDLDEIESVQNENEEDVLLEDNFDDIEKNNEREERLRKFEESDEEFPQNLFDQP